MALTPVGTNSGCELYVEAQLEGYTDNDTVDTLTDFSGHSRNLTTVSTDPVFKESIINGKSVVRWDGSVEPLKNATTFNVKCGWIVAKFNGASFSDYKGLMGGLVSQDLWVSNNTGVNFFDLGDEWAEYRSNDRIYPSAANPAPNNAFKLLFVRFWQTRTVQGIQIGQQRNFTARRWNGDVAMAALYSRDFCEQEIREHSEAIAANFGLSLADVYPYQGDRSSGESPEQNVNFFDPMEGDRISEVLGDPKRVLELQFTSRRKAEKDAMRSFHASHYAAALPFIYRNYQTLPPEDIEGYFDSQYELVGYLNNYNYGFRFKER